MPVRLLRSRRLRWAVLLMAVYAGASYFFPPTTIAQMLTSTLLFVGSAVIGKYFVGVVQYLLSNDNGAVSQLRTGILVGFSGLVLALVWAIAGRITGWEWMIDTPVTGFYLLAYNVAGVLHITARRSPAGTFVRSDIVTVGVALILGGALGLALILLDQARYLRPTLPPPPPEVESSSMGGQHLDSQTRSIAVAKPQQMMLYVADP